MRLPSASPVDGGTNRFQQQQTMSKNERPSSPIDDSTPTTNEDSVDANFPMTLARLVRLPNTFSVLADVAAAAVLVRGTLVSVPRLTCILIAGVLLYWAGMVLNDWFDVEQDAVQRPQRPIPSGAISRGTAGRIGWGLMIAGILVASATGFVDTGRLGSSLLPATIAIGTALFIVLYDGPLKRTPLAPVAMGACRVGSFLLGAASMVPMDAGVLLPAWPGFEKHILVCAFGFGIYVMGITQMARREADTTVDNSGQRRNLVIGLTVAILGIVMIAMMPRYAPAARPWFIDPARIYPLVVGMLGFTIFFRGVR
ncbi:MAG: UbiA family prenyltransferase, partial [Planctomycetota bacterium]